MAAIPLQRETYYPESDGEPMGETEVHIREIMDLIHVLKERYRDAAEVYVGGDMLLYYVEGNPTRRVCPDVFVTIGIPKLPERRSYFLWREGHPPSMVLEVISEGSVKEDLKKRATYAQLGVEEYFLYDPLEDYLHPSLQGYRLVSGQYQPIQAHFDGCLLSETTGLTLRREGTRLRLVETASGQPLLRPDEMRVELDEVRDALREEKRARRAAEEELSRLRRELELRDR